MVARKDLRGLILPTVIGNTDENQNARDRDFDTTDLIFLDDYEDLYKNSNLTDMLTDMDRRVAPTDYAIMNYVWVSNNTNRLNEHTACAWLRSAYSENFVLYVGYNGDWNYDNCCKTNACLRPLLHLNLESNISARSTLQRFSVRQDVQTENRQQYDIREVRDNRDKVLYHTLQLGEYPKTKTSEKTSQILESLYHGGKLREGLTATGRWATSNGAEYDHKFAGKHDPYFEYEGNIYARVVSRPSDENYTYSDKTQAGKTGTVRWSKVEPISWKILNWDEMPQDINPNGNGKAKYFALQSEYGIQSSIPFYPVYYDNNKTMWQNSTTRGFLNGIDVRNITENGNTRYTAKNGGSYIGECNFLNEAFNLTREPIIEYAIPDSEIEIARNSFNGCVTLKRLIIHPNVTSIGKNAFDGCNFKYAYRLKSGELVLDEKLPEKEEYGQVIELGKLAKAFTNFDYGIILGNADLTSLLELSEKLIKAKFALPYVFAKQLQESVNLQAFVEKNDFRFFRNEMPKINDLLLDFPEEERLDFFKFATALRLF